MMRIGRDEMFVNIVKTVALRSTCSRAQVGALIVKDNRIISMGYVGAPSGQPHCIDPGVGCNIGPSGGCIRTDHAERNAIHYAQQEGIDIVGATMYCTHSPCMNCAEAIWRNGIIRLVYLKQYRDLSGLDILLSRGVEFEQYVGETQEG